ncbi:hypothetical protein [Microvirga sp. P5_D2]
MVIDALGELQQVVDGNQAIILATDLLCEFVEDFEWDQGDRIPWLYEIHRLLEQFLLRQGALCIRHDVSEVGDARLHPLPTHCHNGGLAPLWQEETGKLLTEHVRCSEPDENFIGIICDTSFAHGSQGSYDNPDDAPTFPLVGPKNLNSLSDAYEWVVPLEEIRANVSFAAAKQNLSLLGCSSIKKPRGSSHYKVEFPNARPWVLDYNDDPVPEPYLRQLVGLSGYPFDVVLYALLHGRLPERRLRLQR